MKIQHLSLMGKGILQQKEFSSCCSPNQALLLQPAGVRIKAFRNLGSVGVWMENLIYFFLFF